MGAADFAWADGLRRAHFPPERNFVPAHITLFHHLPPSLLPEVTERIREICRGRAPAARLTGIRFMGQGVAYDVESLGLLVIRDELADAFAGSLIPQDQARPRLHITVQNKVAAEDAGKLAERLKADFRPRALQITGLAAWHYLGGPWKLAMNASFRG